MNKEEVLRRIEQVKEAAERLRNQANEDALYASEFSLTTGEMTVGSHIGASFSNLGRLIEDVRLAVEA